MKKQIRNRVMVLITGNQYEELVKAGYQNMTPIVKLFGGPLTWLVTGIEDGILYGYGDIGQGCVEWGGLCHESELPTLRTGIAYLERDRSWKHKEGTQYLSLDTLIGI